LAWLAPNSAPLRIGFVSDLHLGPTTPNALLEDAFTRLSTARLDVLLLGGDYVFLEATEQKAAALARFAARVPARRKLAVLGNHDLWTCHHRLEAAFRSAGVEVMENASIRLDDIAIVGFDDPWVGTIDADAALSGVEAAAVIVMFCHSPDGLPAAERALSRLPNESKALFICGHTHGGQIATPWGPLVVPGHVGKRYPYGLHHLPTMHLYVSRGVGATELPMRTFAPPEIVLFELTSA
jgi:predicted MPP superfamily phosphohydrolase